MCDLKQSAKHGSRQGNALKLWFAVTYVGDSRSIGKRWHDISGPLHIVDKSRTIFHKINHDQF